MGAGHLHAIKFRVLKKPQDLLAEPDHVISYIMEANLNKLWSDLQR